MTTKKQKLIKKSWIIFIVTLALSLGLESHIHPHETFGLEATKFFHAWYGFAACMVIIFLSNFLGHFLKRPEGYYKEDKS